MKKDWVSCLAHVAKTHPWWCGLAILVAWCGPPIAVRLTTGSWAVAGQIGDAFGPATSLFSAFALIGLIVSIHREHGVAVRARRADRADQESRTRQLRLAALSSHIQGIRFLVEEHRAALKSLIPQAPGGLHALPEIQANRAQVERELRTVMSEPDILRLTEAKMRLDSLDALLRQMIEVEDELAESLSGGGM